MLLIGVNHSSNTSIHLAEYRATFPGKKQVVTGAPFSVKGTRKWVEFKDWNTSDSDFSNIGEDFERATGLVKRGRLGLAETMLMPQTKLVDFAVEWLERNRNWEKQY